jgi:pimeloyl-ACP methyl ester carboxylesterase
MSAIYRSEAGRDLVQARYRQLLERWPAGTRRLRVPTRAGETFVVTCGPADAPPVVMLQGSGANAAMWLPDVEAYAQRLRLYAVDVIGEPGASAPARPSLGSAVYADWLDDVLDGLHLERAALVGVSLGGALALDYAARRPQRVDRLVLLAPSGIGRQRPGFLVKAVLLQLLGDRGRRRLLSSALGVRRGQAGPHDQALGEFALLVFKHFRPRTDRVPLADDATLAGLVPPTLVIAGAQDALLDSNDIARRLRECAPHVDLRLLPDAGHYLPGQAPAVLDFLTESSPGSHGALAPAEEWRHRAVPS